MRILSTNTDGQWEFQAWGETVRLVGTCTKKRVWGESIIPRHSVSLTAGVSKVSHTQRTWYNTVYSQMVESNRCSVANILVGFHPPQR